MKTATCRRVEGLLLTAQNLLVRAKVTTQEARRICREAGQPGSAKCVGDLERRISALFGRFDSRMEAFARIRGEEEEAIAYDRERAEVDAGWIPPVRSEGDEN